MDGTDSTQAPLPQQIDVGLFLNSQTQTSRPQDFQCPGELTTISRSVHLARLAAGYEACQQCIHRPETGTLPVALIQSIEKREKQRQRETAVSNLADHTNRQLFSGGALRGVYLNEWTRPVVENIVEHVLDLELHADQRNELRDRDLRVLFAHDWRTSSPDLAVGVVSVLRRWGCEIVDLGNINRSCFDFAMRTFGPDLGLFVTGGDAPESMTGLDILGADAVEWSAPGRLDELRSSLTRPANRTNRQAGTYEAVNVREMYENEIAAKFMGVESIKIALACGDPLALQILGATLLEHGCEVQFLNCNFSNDDFEKEVTKFRRDVRDRHVDVGFLIRPSGQTMFVIDERGRQVESEKLIKIISAETDTTVRSEQNRYFCGTASDALVVIASVLKSLSRSQLPMSAVGNQLAS